MRGPVNRDTVAWVGLVAYIAGAEYLLTKGCHPLMSQAFDRWLSRPQSRVLCWIVVGATSGHLLNLLPNRVDPFHTAFWRIKAWRTGDGDQTRIGSVEV